MIKKGSQGVILFKNAKLFIEREDVQNAVKEIRKKWSIPGGGFKNSKDYLAWLDNLTHSLIPLDDSKIKTITEYEFDFVGKRFYLRRVSEIKTAGIIGKISKYSLFLQDISDHCNNELKEFQHWRFFLNSYITQSKVKDYLQFRSGQTHRTPSIKAIRVRSVDGGEGERKIRLEFGANTTQEDIIGIWNKVKSIQKTMPEYDKTRGKFDFRLPEYLIKHIKAGTKFRAIYAKMPGRISISSRDTVYKEYLRLKKIIKKGQ